MTATADRIRSPKRPLSMDEKERLLNVLARVTGLFGNRGWPFIEVLTDDDEKRCYPITDDNSAVVGYARKLLHEYGKVPLPPQQMGS